MAYVSVDYGRVTIFIRLLLLLLRMAFTKRLHSNKVGLLDYTSGIRRYY